ncbi:MAG: hypothetical protein KatS3mg083_276 [Candidatus Dojkabacteria bacterium]|nr:MAG: hypothetical protein KatS3mg083_276 [Candidatus Dojkabacteria bacterium]
MDDTTKTALLNGLCQTIMTALVIDKLNSLQEMGVKLRKDILELQILETIKTRNLRDRLSVLVYPSTSDSMICQIFLDGKLWFQFYAPNLMS